MDTYYGYAVDHVIKKSLKSRIKGEEELALSDMEKTLSDISEWMKTNRLQMNDAKIEFIILVHVQSTTAKIKYHIPSCSQQLD